MLWYAVRRYVVVGRNSMSCVSFFLPLEYYLLAGIGIGEDPTRVSSVESCSGSRAYESGIGVSRSVDGLPKAGRFFC